jgi:hypothetical protein
MHAFGGPLNAGTPAGSCGCLPADAEATHRTLVHLAQCLVHGGLTLGQREEGEVAQPAEDVGLGKAHTHLDLGFVARFVRSGRQDADPVIRRISSRAFTSRPSTIRRSTAATPDGADSN